MVLLVVVLGGVTDGSTVGVALGIAAVVTGTGLLRNMMVILLVIIAVTQQGLVEITGLVVILVLV